MNDTNEPTVHMWETVYETAITLTLEESKSLIAGTLHGLSFEDEGGIVDRYLGEFPA